jgi:hypothetical protein
LPRYFRLNTDGQIDMAVRWPGWDGWYFFVIPAQPSLPIKMIRASVMTGLYGLNGADDYALLPPKVSQYQAVEHLVLAAVEGNPAGGPGSHSRQNYLSHFYAPKTALQMSSDNLCVQLSCDGLQPRAAPYGRIEGRWPEYQFSFTAPESGLEIELAYRGNNLVWWADIPGVFTYFSAFGELSGKAALTRPAAGGGVVEYEIKGPGCFEHGFARKPFSFDLLYTPVRGLQALFPSFRPLRYHYEVLIGDGNLRGGWMRARGFGIDVRNRGGLHLDGEYVPIQSIAVEYLDAGEEPSFRGSSRAPTTFYKRWRVRADTATGPLEYEATHDWPTAPVARNMTYYNHSFEGTFRGKTICGKGYGEYLHT